MLGLETLLLPVIDFVVGIVEHLPGVADWLANLDISQASSPDNSPHGGH